MDSDRERPHRTTTTTNNNNSNSNSNSNSSSTSELFVCFTSRLSSSSSMKLSSKSILSPGRGGAAARDPSPQISLSASLSRRLKSNGSMKGAGQASPMFPTGGGKRRTLKFENPEPSSPKVTCIGQVRVKTKKQGKKMRARSKRRGEASFRKGEQGGLNPDLTRQNSQSFQFQNHQCLKQHRNQRWVHLPLTICEALREFSCFFPCRSSCTSSEREKEEKGVVVSGLEGGEFGGGGESGGGNGGEGSCGAAFARWLVTLQEGEGKGRGIELVMGPEEEEEEEEKSERSRSSQRRHVFEDIDIDLVEEGKKHEEFGGEGEEEKGGRVSICIPPKNALLLMRCRSDPVKMAALANRFWESPREKIEDQDEEEHKEDSGEEDQEEQEEEGEQDQQQDSEMEEDEEEQEEKEVQVERKTEEDYICESESVAVASEEDIEISLPDQQQEAEAKPDVNVKESFNDIECRMKNPEESNDFSEAKEEEHGKSEEDEDGKGDAHHHQGENFTCLSLPETDADLDNPEMEEAHRRESEEKDPRENENDESFELSSSPALFNASEPENGEAAIPTGVEGLTEEEGAAEVEYAPTHEGSDPVTSLRSKEQEIGSKEERRGKETSLPECLLLMMCEPKLSMEVSKETWVCSTDFIRRLPERPAVKVDGGGGKRASLDSSKVKPKSKPPQAPLMQPPRSSCSFPSGGGRGGGMSMATMIEQKLVGSHNGYEPFVLTRCKSEPMRNSAKLAPEACFWNNRKLEPTAPLGVGAQAGVGF